VRHAASHLDLSPRYATVGDPRSLRDFFGVTVATAEYYASVLTHPGLADVDRVP
jgi:hypothetical protein